MKTLIISAILFLTIAICANGGNIEGTINYANEDTTVVRAAKVVLMDGFGDKLDSVNADANGHFSFTNVIAGTYQLTVHPYHPWGGVNITDALITLRHYVGLHDLDSLPKLAADVSNNNIINSLDALIIAKRFAGLIPSFPSGDWLFESGMLTITGTETINITIYGLCYGDVNQSYVPLNDQFLVCGDTLTDSRDGRPYPTVQIGNQCWMTRNMNIGTMIEGTAEQHHNGTIEKYCYNDDTSNCNYYGGLYQWTEMMQYTSVSGTQGICPDGFHLPTDGEWTSLVVFLLGDLVAGGKMKEVGFTYWNSPNTGATNECGFSARGAGNRLGSGTFFNINEETKIWSSTQHNSNSSWYRSLYNNTAGIVQNNHGKTNGLSVRCLKN